MSGVQRRQIYGGDGVAQICSEPQANFWPFLSSNAALAIFFVPYCLFEIPSNILLKKFKPHVWLSLNMFMFGFVTIMQGIVKSYGGLLTTRFFLGLFETGMFPGCFYLIGE